MKKPRHEPRKDGLDPCAGCDPIEGCPYRCDDAHNIPEHPFNIKRAQEDIDKIVEESRPLPLHPGCSNDITDLPPMQCYPIHHPGHIMIVGDVNDPEVQNQVSCLKMAGIAAFVIDPEQAQVMADQARDKAMENIDKIRITMQEFIDRAPAGVIPDPIPPKLSKRQYGKIANALATTALTGREARRQRRKRNRS